MVSTSSKLATSKRHLEIADTLISKQTALVLRLTARSDSQILGDAWRLLTLFESIRRDMAHHHRMLVREEAKGHRPSPREANLRV